MTGSCETAKNISGVCLPQGFKASGVQAGLKKVKKDIAVIYSEKTAVAAGVFTKNAVKAAPVIVNIENLQITGGKASAIVVNSAVANACTGSRGLADARKMTSLTAENLGIPQDEVLVASTGVIGVTLPMEKIEKGIKDACSKVSKTGGLSAAEAIMTTDTVPKEESLSIEVDGKKIIFGGIAKGSGMIHPNMATMLAFITTDAAISAEALQQALKEVVNDTFNMISVDGDTSTNDMVLVLANGAAGNKQIEIGEENYEKFKEGLAKISEALALKIVEDGEGVTKVFEVEVRNALTIEDARKAARKVTESNLVKTAIFGEDANWGRVIMAIGNSAAQFDPGKVDVIIKSSRGSEQMMREGMGLNFSEEKAADILKEKKITIIVDLNDGSYSAKAWGCDLSYDYVKINADYRS